MVSSGFVGKMMAEVKEKERGHCQDCSWQTYPSWRLLVGKISLTPSSQNLFLYKGFYPFSFLTPKGSCRDTDKINPDLLLKCKTHTDVYAHTHLHLKISLIDLIS